MTTTTTAVDDSRCREGDLSALEALIVTTQLEISALEAQRAAIQARLDDFKERAADYRRQRQWAVDVKARAAERATEEAA